MHVQTQIYLQYVYFIYFVSLEYYLLRMSRMSETEDQDLDVPQATTHLEIVTRLSQLTEIGNKSVTVLYCHGKRVRAAEQECE